MAKVIGTWKFRDSIIEQFSDIEQIANFTCEDVQYDRFIVDIKSRGVFCYGEDTDVGVVMSVAYATELGVSKGYVDTVGWQNENYKTINFGFEQEVSDEFYEWFTANATEVEETKTLKGTWKFRDSITVKSGQNVNFTAQAVENGKSINFNCSAITCVVDARLLYRVASVSGDVPEGSYETLPVEVIVYDANGWNTADYGDGIKTITFTGEQEVSDSFYEWFTANADVYTPGDEPDPDPDVPVDPNRPTADTVIAKIRSLIAKANGVTGKADVDLTDGVNSLIDGYGAGGEVELQEKIVTENGVVTADEGYDGLSKVTVDVPIPEGYIKPTGTLEITENGEYNVSEYENVNVTVGEEEGGGGGSGDLVITDARYFFYYGARTEQLEELIPLLAGNSNFYYTFGYCQSVIAIPELDKLDTSNGTNFQSMFESCTKLTTIPKIDTGNGENFQAMFSRCSKLTTVPELDTSNGTKFTQMFYRCSNLTTIPKLDLSNGTDFYYMFAECSNLTTIPELDTSSGTNFEYMFKDCSKLTSVPELDTSNSAKFNYMFSGCTNLTTIPKIDLNKNTSVSNLFVNCTNLTNLYLYNIKQTIQIGSGTSWGHLLTLESLVHTIKELYTVTSSKTLTIGSANLEKIANVYCKIIDETHEKKTMELCDSTTEGAITLINYAAEKGWQIK